MAAIFSFVVPNSSNPTKAFSRQIIMVGVKLAAIRAVQQELFCWQLSIASPWQQLCKRPRAMRTSQARQEKRAFHAIKKMKCCLKTLTTVLRLQSYFFHARSSSARQHRDTHSSPGFREREKVFITFALTLPCLLPHTRVSLLSKKVSVGLHNISVWIFVILQNQLLY